MIIDPTATATPARIISKSAAGGSPELYDYRLKTSDGRSVVVRSADRGYEAGECVTLGESLHPGWPRIKPAPQAACARITS